MHIPLYVSCDTLNKVKKPWSNVCWIGKETGIAYSIKNGPVSEIQLLSGASRGISRLSKITKTASSLGVTFKGTSIYGILSTGDLFFWEKGTNKLSYAKGLPELRCHLPHSNANEHDGPFDSFLEKIRQFRHEGHGAAEQEENEEQDAACFEPVHQRPKIFASDNCSKVVVVVGASQVFIWLKDTANTNKEHLNVVNGTWSVAACPSDVPIPSQLSKETEISACFCNEAPFGEQCLISFSFIDEASLITTSLLLRWKISGGFDHNETEMASALCHSVRTPFKSVGISEGEQILQEKGSLIARFAHQAPILCVAVNSPLKFSSKLIYLHPLSETVISEVIENNDSMFSSKQATGMEMHCVTDMAWSRNNLYVVGCFSMGAIFMSSRMGPLLKISCTGGNLNLQVSTLLGLHPHATLQKIFEKDEKEAGSCDARNLDFCLSFHPYCDKFLFSSGHRVSVLSLPENCCRDEEVADHLIASALHALHSLQNSSVTHDYAYIRSSTWRLAQSLPNLYQSFENISKLKNCEVKLWGKEGASSQEPDKIRMLPTEDERLIGEVIQHLLGAWTLILTHTDPHTRDWKKRTKNVSKILVNFISTMLQTTMDDDRPVHQAQIVHMLHIFHRFVSLLQVWPQSFHMVKATLALAHRIIHAILKCEKHGSERNMIDTLLVLTQTASSIEKQLVKIYNFQHVMESSQSHDNETVQDFPNCLVSNVKVLTMASNRTYYKSSLYQRLKPVWSCLHSSVQRVYLKTQDKKYEKNSYLKCVTVMNLVQRKLQDLSCDLTFQRVRVDQGNKLSLSGMHYGAIEVWKRDLVSYIDLNQRSSKRKLSRILHSIMYTYVIMKDYSALAMYIGWLYNIITINNRKCFMLPSHLKVQVSKRELDQQIKPPEVEQSLSASERRKEGSSKKTSKRLPENPPNLNNQDTPPSANTQEILTSSKTVRKLVSSVRLMIGSLGRIVAKVVLGKDVYLPTPHRPHVITPLWLDQNTRQKDNAMIPSTSNHLKELQEGHLSAVVAAQALCFAGHWFDLVFFAKELGDTRTALLASVIAAKTNPISLPFPDSFQPKTIMKELLVATWHKRELDASLFHSYRELFKLASVAKVKILPSVLATCIASVQDIVQHLTLIVPHEVYLPAPPVFCPQPFPSDKSDEENEHEEEEEDKRNINRRDGGQLIRSIEVSSRKSLAGWVRLFAVVASSAGLAEHLLNQWCSNFSDPGYGNSDVFLVEIKKLSETLSPKKGHEPKSQEWKQITQLWEELLHELWLLNCRDKLSALLRKFSTLSPYQLKRQRKIVDIPLEILGWSRELYNQTDNAKWKGEVLAIALVAASNATPSQELASVLATILPDASKLPSLLKDKARRLFDVWKNVILEADDSQKDISTPNLSPNLFAFYERQCEKMKEENEGDNIVPLNFKRTTKEMEKEYQKLVYLFASMNFAKDAEAFPDCQGQIPLMIEYSSYVKKLELRGLKIKKQLFKDHSIDCMLDYPAHLSENVEYPSKMFGEKRGLFRNLTYTGIWQTSTAVEVHVETPFIISSRRTKTLSPSDAKVRKRHLSSQDDYSSSKLSSYGSSKYSPSHKVRKYGHLTTKSPLHSSRPPRKRTKSLQHMKESGKRRRSFSLDSSSPSESSISLGQSVRQLLAHAKQWNVSEDGVFQYDILFIHWMMTRERIVIPHSTAKESKPLNIALKVNLHLDDVVCAVLWQHYPLIIADSTYLKENSDSRKEEVSKVDASPERVKKAHSKKNNSTRGKRKNDTSEVGYLPASTENIESNHQLIPMHNKEVRTHNIGSDNDKVCLSQDQLPSLSPSVVSDRYEENLNQEASDNGKIDTADGPSTIMQDENILPKVPVADFENGEGNSENPVEAILSGHKSERTDIEKHFSDKNLPHLPAAEKMAANITISLPDEIKNMVDVHQESVQAMINAVELFQKSLLERSEKLPEESHDVGNQTSEKSASVGLVDNATESSTTEGRNAKRETVSNSSSRDKGSMDSQSLSAPSNHPQAKNPWTPFKMQLDSPVKPPRLVLEVHKAAEGQDQQDHETGPVLHKKKSLTPVETPSEIFDLNVQAAPKLLHIFPNSEEEQDDNKKLSLSDLDEDEECTYGEYMGAPADDTLDDITLPDSLHASDLEEEKDASWASQQLIQEKITRSNFQKTKDKMCDLGKSFSKKAMLKSMTGLQPKRSEPSSHPWDKHLLLKPVPFNMKQAVTRKGNEDVISDINPPNLDNPMIKQGSQVPLKLLVLPKQENILSPKESPKHHKPLTLKRFPLGVLQRPFGSEDKIKFSMKNKENDAKITTNTSIVPDEVSSKVKKELSLLRLPSSTSKVQNERRGDSTFKFLHPSEVFSFYRRHMEKGKENRFKTLKMIENQNRKQSSTPSDGISDRIVVPREPVKQVTSNRYRKLSAAEVELVDNVAESKKPDIQQNSQVRDSKCDEKESHENWKVADLSIPRDKQGQATDIEFLGKVQQYAEKYRFGEYKDVLEAKSPKQDKPTSPAFQFDATRQMAQVYDLQKKHAQATKEVQTGPYVDPQLNRNLTRDCNISTSISQGVQTTELHNGESVTNVDAVDVSSGTKNYTRKTFESTPQVQIEREDSKARHRALDVKDSWTETVPSEKIKRIEMQTQTQPLATVDASVVTEESDLPSVTPSMSHVTLAFNPSGVTLDPYSHVSLPEDRGGNIAQVVNIPDDVIHERLLSIGEELNRTVPSVVLPNEDADGIPTTSYHQYSKGFSVSEDTENSPQGAGHGAIPRQGYESSGSKLEYMPLTGLKNMEVESETKQNLSKTETSQTTRNEDFIRENLPRNKSLKTFNDQDFGLEKTLKLGHDDATADSEQITRSHTVEGSVITMDTLMQDFINGKIKFEEFCRLSSDVEKEEPAASKEAKQRRVNIEEIEELEKEAEAAARGLRASKDILSRLDVAMQESQRTESVRKKYFGRFEESNFGNFTPTKKHYSNKSSLERDWQQALNQCRITQNSSGLLQFVENVSSEDITKDMIETIMDCVDAEERQLEKNLSVNRTNNSNECHMNDMTLQGDGSSRSIRRRSSADIAEILREYSTGQDPLGYPLQSPKFPINLRGLRSECSSELGSPNLSFFQQSNLPSEAERERSDKRAEIRKWMRVKRKERLEKFAAMQEKSSYMKISSQGKPPEPKRKISGKEIRDSSREREKKRRQLRESLQSKLESDMSDLLSDHEKQASTHRDLLFSTRESLTAKPLLVTTAKSDTCRSKTRGRKFSSQGNRNFVSKRKLNETFIIPKASPLQLADVSSIAASTDDLSSDILLQSDSSSFSMRELSSPTVTDSKQVLYQKITTEMDNLKRCLQESVVKTPKVEPKIIPSGNSGTQLKQSSDNISSQRSVGNKIQKGVKHQRSLTVNLPLERISEVDSDTASSNSRHLIRNKNYHEDTNITSPSDSTSDNSSWNVPSEVKNLLKK